MIGGPSLVNDFLGGDGSESGGFGRFPATKAELRAALREIVEEQDETTLMADADWFDAHLPEGTYRDAGEVMVALAPSISGLPMPAGSWVRDTPVRALPAGIALHVPPGQVAVLRSGRGVAFDVFPPGQHRLTRDSAPEAARGSRPPAPSFPRSVLDASPVFLDTGDRTAQVIVAARSSAGFPVGVRATVVFYVADGRRFVASRANRSLVPPAPDDKFLSALLEPSLAPLFRDRGAEAVAGDRPRVEAAIRSGLEGVGLGVRSLRIDHVGSMLDAPATGPSFGGALANMPPEVRAQFEARMAEAMRRRAATPSPPGPPPRGPPPGSGTSGPSGAGGLACRACGRANLPGTKFCGNCGQPLASRRSCPACGKEIGPDVKFCGSCGQRLPA